MGRVYVVGSGSVLGANGAAIGPIGGIASLFDGADVGRLIADPKEGVHLVWVTKHAFFTVCRECPEVLRGFLELGAAGRLAENKLS